MSNEIDEDKELHNNSASLKDYEIEVEEPERKGFFASIVDRIKNGNSTKLLDSGDKQTFQKTNRSISSMWTIASLRRSIMEKLENINKSFFRTPENIDQSNITREVIGQTPKSIDDLAQANAKTTTFEPVIPIAKSAQLRAERIIPQPVKNGIINNAKTAEDVRQENTGLKVEEVTISEDFVEEKSLEDTNIDSLTAGDIINSKLTKAKENEPEKPAIEVAEITVGKLQTKEKDSTKDEDERI